VNRNLLESEWARRVFFWGCGLMGVAAFYVLSIGPAAKLHNSVENPTVRNTIEIVYTPVVWLINSSDILQAASLWYVRLWVDFG